MLVILVALGLAVFGVVHFTRDLQPRQRAVAWAVFVLAIVLLFWKLVELGWLGRAAGAES
jgi:hypothetical protein